MTPQQNSSGNGTPSGLARYYWTKMSQLQRMEFLLGRHQRSFDSFSSILDFGCGFGLFAGRILSLNPNARICGYEVSAECIDVCRRKYPAGRWVLGEPRPPLPFSNHEFDFIFSYSVFTHLPEDIHRSWLRELARTLKPGGIMAHTIHSEECLKRMARYSPESLSHYRLPGSLEEFLRAPLPYHYAIDNPQTPEFGRAIIRKSYVLEEWPRLSGLKILDYVDGAMEVHPEGCQDLVLLIRY